MSRDISIASQNASAENTSAEVFLYEIELDDGLFGFVSPGSLSYTIGGINYKAWPISHQPIKNNVKLQVMETSVSIDNVPQELSAYAANGGKINGRGFTIYQVDRTLIADKDNWLLLIRGIMDGFSIDNRNFTVSVKRSITKWDDEIPRGTYGNLCQLIFKSKYCGYIGQETTCGKTWERCVSLNNQGSFLGFKSVPKEQVVK